MPRFRFRLNTLPRLIGPGLLAVGLIACSPGTPVPPPDGLIAPKQLATVVISPTPVETMVVPPTVTRAASPTPTRLPPTATPTPTPYVGVFMGDGSAPLVLPTASIAALVVATLLPPTPLGGNPANVFPTATPLSGMSVAPLTALPVGSCGVELAVVFQGPYSADPGVSAVLGCPISPPETVPMAEQAFQQGKMFWLATGDIYALSTEVFNGASNAFWRVQDTWQEGMPESDPSMTSPPDVLQPIRGFGLAWRTNAQIRSAIGWALSVESGYTGTVQRFERGTMLTAQSGGAYVLLPQDNPPTVGRYIGPLS